MTHQPFDLDRVAADFWRHGYVVIDDFFAAPAVEVLDATIVGHFGATPAYQHGDDFLAGAQTEVVPWFPQREGVADFDAIDADARLAELTTAVLGPDWSAQYCMVMFSRQGSSGQAWHQDCPPEDAAIHNLNRLVYTRDIAAGIGGQVVLVPGSHRRGLLTAGDPHADLPGEVVLSPRRGTVVLLHGHTWHRVLPVTGGFRFSINYRAAPAGTPDDITDTCVYRNMRYRFSTAEVIEHRVAEDAVV